jgi:hypothetical protein
MPQVIWQFLTTEPNTPSAQAMLSWLADHGVTAKVVSDTSLLGQFQLCLVFVDARQARRVHWLLAQRNFSDEELTVLATASAAPVEAD